MCERYLKIGTAYTHNNTDNLHAYSQACSQVCFIGTVTSVYKHNYMRVIFLFLFVCLKACIFPSNLKILKTHIVCNQVRVGMVNTIIKDTDNNTFSCEPTGPCHFYIQVNVLLSTTLTTVSLHIKNSLLQSFTFLHP